MWFKSGIRKSPKAEQAEGDELCSRNYNIGAISALGSRKVRTQKILSTNLDNLFTFFFLFLKFIYFTLGAYYIWHFSPCYPSPIPPTLSLPDPSVQCSPPCVHVFSLFNTHLWVRTCSVWFSVLVSVCWEWWFPDTSVSLQRTQTHHFYGCIVFHGVYVPHFLYPVYHWWAFGLVPSLCYCK